MGLTLNIHVWTENMGLALNFHVWTENMNLALNIPVTHLKLYNVHTCSSTHLLIISLPLLKPNETNPLTL